VGSASSATVADATFQLLASSTIKRYLRVAREIADHAGLIAAIRATAETASQALDRARALWNAVSGADTRIPEESSRDSHSRVRSVWLPAALVPAHELLGSPWLWAVRVSQT
jgi:hypothetical protein